MLCLMKDSAVAHHLAPLQVTEPSHRTRTQGVGCDIALLPRHWEWLAVQPRSASATLRLLVEDARRDRDGRYRVRESKEACYLFMRDMAGDRPCFEEACRALFADNAPLFEELVSRWPADIQDMVRAFAAPAWAGVADVRRKP